MTILPVHGYYLVRALVVGVVTLGPEAARRILGWPKQLTTTSDTKIRSMALSGNGEVLAAGGSVEGPRGLKPDSGTIHLWNARTGKPLAPIPPAYALDRNGLRITWDGSSLNLSPNAKQIGLSRMSRDWSLYDLPTRQLLWSFPKPISDAEFSRDGRFIALSGGRYIFVVNANNGRVRAQWRRGGFANSQDLAYSPDGRLVAHIGSYMAKNPIEVHRADNGRLVRRIDSKPVLTDELFTSVAFSPDSKRLIVAICIGNQSWDENISLFTPLRCFDVTTGKLLWGVKADALEGATGTRAHFCDAIFSPDGSRVAAYQYIEGRILLLDSATGATKTTRQLNIVNRSNYYVPPGLAFSPDGKRLFVRGKNAIFWWDLD